MFSVRAFIPWNVNPMASSIGLSLSHCFMSLDAVTQEVTTFVDSSEATMPPGHSVF
jgi:hypothetical protein